jgi:NitT/TauT family transport system substrate-binding protein
VYWALPIYVAEEMGFFVYQGLQVSYEVYPSGGPQVEAAVEGKAWDIGAGGVVPNIIGGLNDIETIGISNDESETNALVGTAAWPPSPDTNVTITVTPNSTAHFVVAECLVKDGLNSSLLTFDDPASVLEALTPDANGLTTFNYGGLWAPDLYLFLENTPGSAVLCSGRDVGVTVPGGIMVRKAFGEENSKTVAKVLAAWFRAIEFMKDGANRAQVLSYMETYYAIYNVSISQAAMEKEIDLRPIHALDEQLYLFKRENVNSTVDIWYRDVGLFMEEAGAIQANPDPESYITDKYLQLVREDSNLRAFALGQDPDATPSLAAPPTVAPTSEAVDVRTSYQLVSGTLIVVFAFALVY